MAKVIQFFKLYKFSFIILFATLFAPLLATTATAQQKEVQGVVIDAETREPIAGANVFNSNEKTGVGTDEDGKFRLVVKTFPSSLSVSYVGYRTLAIDLYDYTEPLTLSLVEDRATIGEVVVIGYGTQRRRELTGAIASVPKDVLSQPVISIESALGGVVAGLNVTATSGQPGATSTVRIRGGNSITGGNEPLYVIDGVIVYNDVSATRTGGGKFEGGLNPLTSLNPADVESVEVLKDVSATAIYGSRGANGVILITTRKGQKGKSVINYSNSFGWASAARRIELLNGSQWAEVYQEATGTDWREAAYGRHDEAGNLVNAAEVNAIDRNRNYDWQDAALQQGFTQTHQISVSGGDEKTRYLLSGNYTDQKGIVINSGLERYIGRINFERDLTAKLNVGTNITVSQTTTSGFANYASINSGGRVSGSFDYALRQAPVFPIYTDEAKKTFNYNFPLADGDFKISESGVNPIADLRNTSADTRNSSVLANFHADYDILQGLTAKLNSGFSQNQTEQSFYAPALSGTGLLTNGYGSVGNKFYNTWQHEFTLNYNRRIEDIHFIDALAGYTTQSTKVKYSTGSSTNYLNETLGYNDLSGGSTFLAPTSGGAESSLRSWLGRVNYSLREKYNLTATFRADGSSRFAAGNRWGYFPSLGLSWNIDKEGFFDGFKRASNSVETRSAGFQPAFRSADFQPANQQQFYLSSLKLRASIGTVGNQEIGDYRYADLYSSTQYSFGGQLVTGYLRANLANPDLKWETTTQGNIGLDVGFVNERYTASLDAYIKKTSDLLVDIPVEYTTGFTSQLANVGSVSNKGIELELGALIIDKKFLRWSVNANIAHNRNEVTSLGKLTQFFPTVDSKTLNTLSEISDGVLIVRVGEPLGTFYGYRFEGVVQTDAEAASTARPGWYSDAQTVQKGDPRFEDVNSDGVIDASNDRVALGSIQPDFTYGLSSSLTVRRFDAALLFAGSQGNELYNGLQHNLETVTNKGYNLSGTLADRWTATNPSTSVPRAVTATSIRVDSRYIEDASFLKLRNITLGYTLPLRSTVNKQFKIRLFASAQNLFTITNYRGYDPEATRFGGNESNTLFQGIDLGAYPSARTFLFGFNLSL